MLYSENLYNNTLITVLQNISWKNCIKNAPDSVEKGSVAVDANKSIAYFTTIKSGKVLCYDAVRKRWSTITCEERVNFSVAIIGQHGLTAVGGLADNKALNTLLCYQNKQWKTIHELPPMNYDREYPAVVTTDACVVVASGKDLDSVEILLLVPGTRQWKDVARLPKIPLYSIGTVCHGMVFIMDWDGNYYTCSLKTLESSQPPEYELWSKSTYYGCGEQKKVEHATPVTINDRLFLIGGHRGSYDKALSDINELEYNEQSDTWNCRQFATMPMHRYRCLAAGLPGNRLLVVGGNREIKLGCFKINVNFNTAHLGELN